MHPVPAAVRIMMRLKDTVLCCAKLTANALGAFVISGAPGIISAVVTGFGVAAAPSVTAKAARLNVPPT